MRNKTVKIYLVFKDNESTGMSYLLYVGKSKRQAKNTFVTEGVKLMSSTFDRAIKLKYAKVTATEGEYETFLYLNHQETWDVLSNLAYLPTWEEHGVITDKTFDLDFIPWYGVHDKIHPQVLRFSGVIDKLLEEGSLQPWMKKYLKRNF